MEIFHFLCTWNVEDCRPGLGMASWSGRALRLGLGFGDSDCREFGTSIVSANSRISAMSLLCTSEDDIYEGRDVD